MGRHLFVAMEGFIGLTEFDAIRPYTDDEVAPVIRRLLKDREFLDLIARFTAPRLHSLLPAMARLGVGFGLGARFGRLKSVREVQEQVVPYMAGAVRNTTDGVTFSGFENIPDGGPCVFVSNHRDIVFDPAIVNYGLWQQGLDTARIAIGDNLTANPHVADLMRLNKSFIVRRNLKDRREIRDTYLQLSRFIRHSLAEGESVWIAQREGRAKDGIDRTDPAVIKMMTMAAKRNGEAFTDAIAALRIVPVAISYEYDPCDLRKASELAGRAQGESGGKSGEEDLQSIVAGLSGYKGRVHVAFAPPLMDPPDSPKAVAAAIDAAILAHYRLYPINDLAYERYRALHNESDWPPLPSSDETVAKQPAARILGARLETSEPSLHPYILAMYANPLIRRELGEERAITAPS